MPILPTLQAYWRWNAWALVVLGVVQAVAGITTTLFLTPKGDGHNGMRSNALLAYLF